jgi:hypothetical protein
MPYILIINFSKLIIMMILAHLKGQTIMINFNNPLLKIVFATVIATSSAASSFACSNSDVQQIRLSVGDTVIAEWAGTSDNIRQIQLPNEFKLGVKIEETSREKYEDLMQRLKTESVPALVKISLYDMTDTTPRRITSTWGGVNSHQGYGPKGGADRVDEVGSQGILFSLAKSICINTNARLELTKNMIAQHPTALALKQADEKSQPNAENLRGEAAAIADVKAGNYRIVYPNAALKPEEKTVMTRVFNEAGLQLIIEGEALSANDVGFNKGYTRTMMKAVSDKLGRAKMKAIEAKIKAGVAELALSTN